MPASTLPGTVPEPSGTRPDHGQPGPAPASAPAADWPKDVHLPDEREEAEC